MTKFSSFLHLLGSLFLIHISACVPTPSAPVGFVYDPDSFEAPVRFDFYIDQICPDSKRAWPTVIQIAKHYGPKKLKLTTHLFPLPYLRNGFRASVSTHVLASINSSLVYPWIQKVFDNIDDLTASANTNKSDDEMNTKFLRLAEKQGVDGQRLVSGLSNGSRTWEAIVDWKYACTRRIAETPTFLVNDVVVGFTEASYWSLEDWRNILDPLVGDTPPSRHTTTTKPCTSGTKTFGPGILSVVLAMSYPLAVLTSF